MSETQNSPQGPAPDPAAGATVLLVADPGLPTHRARSIEDSLQQHLDEVYHPPIRLQVRTSMLRLRPDGTLDLSEVLEQARSSGDPDAVLLLTEIPRLRDGRPLIAEIFPEHNIAVISCPTLGVLTTRRRILDALMRCTLRMAPTSEPRDASRYARRWAQWEELTGPDDHQLLLGSRVIGGARTVAGMVAGNEPLRTAPKLSSALAAAAATGAFGIFYSSIWSMSMHLTTQRLLLIGILAMCTITAWLIVGNRLWDAPRQERLARVVLLYNLSTVLTLLMIVALLYVCLVVLIFTSALIVIAPDYLAEVIGREPVLARYLDIAWLSAAMGVVAGALGSSFDKDTDMRSLTHGQRERQRRFTEEEVGQ
ncbi:MAG: hypothetical protein ACTMH5_07215 [Brachybacterium sp.]|uniref:hypothetical protein n=1 Tax=Brachybacterium sp. TaxID=1891286 RepID=UPI003F91F3C4